MSTILTTFCPPSAACGGVRVDSTRSFQSLYRVAHLPIGQGFTAGSVCIGLAGTAAATAGLRELP